MPAYSSAVHFDSIIVIESLPLTHRRTGQRLANDVLRPQEAAGGLKVSYNFVRNRTEFFAVLDAAQSQYFDQGRAPILHLEAHGDKNGLRLASNEVILWEELREHLTDMNRMCGLNLLVVMAMCSGFYLAKLLLPFHRAPLWGLLGPTKAINDTDLEKAMKAFYTELLSSFDLDRATKAANAHYLAGDRVYAFWPAELLFFLAFREYVRINDEETLRQREDEIVAMTLRKRGDYSVTTAMQVRADAHRQLRDHRAFFDHYRRRFLMLDELPDGNARFLLTYEDCERAAQIER